MIVRRLRIVESKLATENTEGTERRGKQREASSTSGFVLLGALGVLGG
jgi:hypothetical protein